MATDTAGTKMGQISFANNDSDENPFNFPVTGQVSPPPTLVYVDGASDCLNPDGGQRCPFRTSVHLEVIGMDGGVFRMRVTGPIGGQAQLQYSSDLATWDNLGVAVTFGVTPIAVSDPDASQHPQRFYPAVLQ